MPLQLNAEEGLKVFISWSGPRSRAVALALHGWLPNVIQTIQPWMSQRDIGAGSTSGAEINDGLREADFGICCVTPENQDTPWLNYEAGALARGLTDRRVVPYLLGFDDAIEMRPGPLSRLQAKLALSETKDVLVEINRTIASHGAAGSLTEDRLGDAFRIWWDTLRVKLESIPPAPNAPEKPRVDEMVKEILESMREMTRRAPAAAAMVQAEESDVRVFSSNLVRRILRIQLDAADITLDAVTRRGHAWEIISARGADKLLTRIDASSAEWNDSQELADFLHRAVTTDWGVRSATTLHGE